MKKIKDLIIKLLNYQQIRFLLVGVLNTAVGYGVFALLVYLGVNYLIANTLSTIIGIIHSYFWNKFFTFKSKSKVKSEIFKFVFVYFISYLIGTVNIALLVSKMDLSEYIAGAVNLFFTTIISWLGHKYFSFKESKA